MTETDRPSPEVGKRPLANLANHFGYVRLVTDRGVTLSLHDSAGSPGWFWLTTQNIRSDYSPARLTLDEVRALRDGCNLILDEVGRSRGGPEEERSELATTTHETGRPG